MAQARQKSDGASVAVRSAVTPLTAAALRLCRKGDLPAGVSLLRRAMALHPECPWTLSMLLPRVPHGERRALAHELWVLDCQFEAAQGPDSDTGRRCALEALMARLNRAEAVAPRPSIALLKARLLAEEAGNPRAAEAVLVSAVRRFPEVATLHAALGTLYQGPLADPQGAERALRRAVALDPDAAEAWSCLGDVLCHQLAQPSQAAAAYGQALRVDPDLPSTRLALAQVLAHELGHGAAALDHFQALIALGGPRRRLAWLWTQVGQVQEERLADVPSALDAYDQAVALDARARMARARRTALRLEQGATEAVEADLRLLSEQDPSGAWAPLQLGQLAEQAGDGEGAAHWYREALARRAPLGAAEKGLARVTGAT